MTPWLILTIIAALLAIAGVSVVLIVRAYRRGAPAPRRAKPGSSPPIVLVHGLMGFDRIDLLGTAQHYFRGIKDALESRGLVVHTPRLPPLGSVPARALALSDFLASIAARDAVLIAHSLGGLDSRYAIANGAAPRVRALVTIGTPHRGTWFAGLAEQVPARLLRAVLGRAGLRSDALSWLSEDRLERFNREVRDVDGVFYGSVICRASRMQLLGNPALLATYEVLRLGRGDNDGLVPVASQRWGRVIADVRADHLAQIGWHKRYDASALFLAVISDLAKRGLAPGAALPHRELRQIAARR